MYGYERKFQDKDDILSNIDQKLAFSILLEEMIEEGVFYKSPFREDNSAGCFFEWYGGKLRFKDFAEPNYHKQRRDIFEFVKDKFKVNFGEALKILQDNMEAYELSPESKQRLLLTTKSQEERTNNAVLFYKGRLFDKRDQNYWSRFLISRSELDSDGVTAVEKYGIIKGKRKVFLTPSTICYAYSFGPKVKLYKPYEQSKYKFITNCGSNDIGNLHNLPKIGKQLVISKSYKDSRVLRTTLESESVIWNQSENIIPSEEILTDLTNRYSEVVVLYDNDQAGYSNSEKFTAAMKALSNPDCNIRSAFLPRWKDPAEFISKEGRVSLLQNLRELGIHPDPIT